MSGIAGIYNRNGQPVDRELLGRMTDAIAHRGPDGTRQWIDGAVGFGHQMLCTTPESLHETQPLQDANGQLCLVMDGRVDNCAELRAALRARGARLRDDTDAELVLQSYIVWGEECPKHIIGDFAFAVWDARRQQLFCARDFMGIKPFYYYLDECTFRFGSELHQILEDRAISREPNEGMIGEYLADQIVSREETLYQSIMRLPPAHAMIVRRESVRKHCYWQLDGTRTIRYGSDAEYAEHFLSVFEEAVRCRMRSHRPVGAYLSGGLDSSSVVAVAQGLINAGRAHVAGFETFSVLFPDWPAADEREYIDQVVDMWKLKWHGLLPSPIKPDHYAAQARFYKDFPDYPNGTDLECIMELARDAGIRVLLSGMGGDEWLLGGKYYYADLFWRLRLHELAYELRLDFRSIGMRETAKYVFAYGLRPLIPVHLRRSIRSRMRVAAAPAWLDEQFAVRNQTATRLMPKPIERHGDSYTRREIERLLLTGALVHSYETQDRMASRFGIEERHPFDDRRIFEFCANLPLEQRYRKGFTKFTLRDAMLGLLPEDVRLRTTKAEFSHLYLQTIDIVGGRQKISDWNGLEIDWFDSAKILALYDAMEQDIAHGDYAYVPRMAQLWRVYGLQEWYDANEKPSMPSVSKPINLHMAETAY